MAQFGDIKEQLDKLVSDLRRKKFDKEDRKELIKSVGDDLLQALRPVLKEIAQNSRLSRDELKDIISQIKIDIGMPDIEIPEISIPEIKIPEIKLPEIIIPKIDVPTAQVNLPNKMKVEGEVSLKGISRDKPLAVTLFDLDGKPIDSFKEITQIIAGGGGGFIPPKSLQIRDIVDSTGASLVNSDGRLRVTTLGAAGDTTVVVGEIASDVADNESAPVKVGGIARTANPTAVAAGDRVSATFDDVGRQVIQLYQVRDLVQTARATLTTGTEATLLSGAAGVFFDLAYIAGANSSNGAVTVDIRAATGAGVVLTLEIPARGVAGLALPVPIPQDVAAATWTADMEDVTGTTVQIQGLFIRNV